MNLHWMIEAVSWLHWGLFAAVGIAGIVGAIVALTMREDAFQAGDRQSKLVWVAMLAGSAFVAFAYPLLTFLSFIGAVVIGIFWFDVRPQLKGIINGDNLW